VTTARPSFSDHHSNNFLWFSGFGLNLSLILSVVETLVSKVQAAKAHMEVPRMAEEEPITVKTYKEIQDAALGSVRDLSSGLQDRLRSSLKYRMVSQSQAAPAEKAYYLWHQAGGTSAQPSFDAASTRAVLYNQAAAARQLEAFLQVSRVTIFELCQTAIRTFEAHEMAAFYMTIRGLVERIANVAALADALQDFSRATPSPDKPNEPLLLAAGQIGKALYGTKFDWGKLRNADLRAAKKDDVAYVRKELSMDVAARSVLTSIDKLDKRVRGARIAYEVLCEFLHPNVGDLYSATACATSHSDRLGTRHVTRELGLGPKDFSTSFDLVAIMSQVLSICCEVFRLLPSVLAELDANSRKAEEMAKSFAHIVRNNYKPLFRKDDLCPCLSGLTVRKCR
jgi:hypothetical protein